MDQKKTRYLDNFHAVILLKVKLKPMVSTDDTLFLTDILYKKSQIASMMSKASMMSSKT